MDFAREIGLWQRRIAEGLEGNARRQVVLEALAVTAGQSILDIGCCGGHLVRELALSVGAKGRAVGLDVSAEQLEVARSESADFPAAEFVEGSATRMDFSDASFDGLASINTFDYIADTDAALVETRRVLKRGANTALVCVLWDHFRFHGAEPALNERMLDAFRAHCPHQMLPLELPRKLAAAGFGGIARRPLPVFNGALHENASASWLAKVIAVYATGQGVAEDDAKRWLQQLESADKDGRFGFVSVPVLTTATAL